MRTYSHWWISRPVRRAPDLQRATSCLLEAASSDPNTGRGRPWTREVHRALEEALGRASLKRNRVSHDGSGGRTWGALLRSFGLRYPDPQDRTTVMTDAGLALALEKPGWHLTLKKQILCYQIPSAYFQSRDFRARFKSGMRVFPFRALFRLLLHGSLGGVLHKDEVVAYAMWMEHDSDACVERTVREIVAGRASPNGPRATAAAVISRRVNERHRRDRGRRHLKAVLADIVHTFMLQAQTAFPDELGLRSEEGSQVLALRPGQADSLRSWLKLADEMWDFISPEFPEEVFARRQGREYWKAKASGRLGSVTSPATKNRKRAEELLQKVLASEAPRIPALEECIQLVLKRDPFLSEDDVRAVVGDRYPLLLERSLDSFWERLIEEGRGEHPLEFEDRVRRALTFFGLAVKRVRDTDGVFWGRRLGGLLECKASAGPYSPGKKDRLVMQHDYVPSAKEFLARKGVELQLVLYVIGNGLRAGRGTIQMFERVLKVPVRWTTPQEQVSLGARPATERPQGDDFISYFAGRR